jgi:hypothetical protein
VPGRAYDFRPNRMKFTEVGEKALDFHVVLMELS